ncbi:MAG: sugar porter family MFS transporter [Microscillaceae bacterium]|jgi:sugar porter (SP) family MFS transporter|nr:sugar porter family MFS transporter [Microscillaceae bacterium]
MNKSIKLVFWAITVALGGFLFGLDTAVISGAEKDIQALWHLGDFYHGLAVAMALYGTVFGALLGGFPADKWGRKPTLFWIGILYLVSAVGAAVAWDYYSFIFFRFLGGLGVGASSVAAPLYISEISPPKSRGQLVALFQFNIVLGILIAYFSNYMLESTNPDDWRWMLGVVALPSLLFTVMVLGVPESPRWLILKKGDLNAAKKILQIISDKPQELLKNIQASNTHQARKKVNFGDAQYRLPIMLAFLFAFFNQWSGINAIIYYAPRIFQMTGLGNESALLSTTGIGLVNLIFTIGGMFLIDRFGRKVLMYVGSLGLITTLLLVSYAFFTEQFAGVPYYLFVYIAFFAFSQGAVIWVFISEVFPNEVRAYGQALGSFTHWIFAAVIANIFPILANTLGGGLIFLFFGAMMILQLLFVWRMMPETKGIALEDLEGVIRVGH